MLVAAFMLLLTLPMQVAAQTSSINAYSPYSMYGPGELLTPGNVQMRSMGGVGIAQRTLGQINTQNPAAASSAPQKSFLFDFAFDGTHFRNNQTKYNSEGVKSGVAKTAYNSINIHNISLAFPLAKKLGATFSVAPYSSVGYKLKTTDQQQDNWADIGRVLYTHAGDGDITEVKLAVGWAPWQRFSIGVAAKYFWGNIERTYTTAITDPVTGSGSYASIIGTDNYIVNNVKLQAGIQWNIIHNEKRMLTLGATYDLGGKLNPKRETNIESNSVINTINGLPIRERIDAVELKVPHQVGVGIYYQDRTIVWGIDYNYAAWGSSNDSYSEEIANIEQVVAYTNTHTIKAGFEITPRKNDVRNYLNRISYRLGARVGNYYQTFAGERINQLAITTGFGLPVKIWGASSINVGFEYGRNSAPSATNIAGEKVGLVTQNYFKFSVGFSLFSADTSDYWFVRQKFD